MKKAIEVLASKTLKRASNILSNYDEKKEALNVLKKIELIRGKTSP